MRLIRSFALFAGLLLALAATSSAGVITVDAGWYGFCFGVTGSGATDGCQNGGVGTGGNPTSFTASGPVLFQVTDAFLSGDSFHVEINGGAITFNTPSVPYATSSLSDPDAAFASSDFSHYSLALGAGTYEINVYAADSPNGAGGAFLRAITDTNPAETPEPASVALVAAGLGLLGLRRAYKR